MNLESKIYCIQCKKVTATTSMTRTVSKRNDVPIIKCICALCGFYLFRKIALKKKK